jgi:hypothetical protein
MTTSSRIRRAATVGGCVVTAGLGALATAGAAQAQTVHAGAVPHAEPSASRQDAPGVRLMKVRSVEGTVTPDIYEGCSAGYFCLSQIPHSGGEVWVAFLENARLNGGGYSYSWGKCGPGGHPGCDLGIHAWANNTGDRVWLKEFKTGGDELCISNHTWNSNYEGIADNDYWIQITTNPNPC